MISLDAAPTPPQVRSGVEPMKMRLASRGSAPAVFADVFQEDINMAIWERTLSEELRQAVDGVITSGIPVSSAMTLAPHNAVEAISEALRTDPSCLVSQDIARLIGMFCMLLGIPRAGLRLRVLDGPMCPKFHVDRVPCRLLTSYHGVGTQWIPHAAVDRSKLGPGGRRPDGQAGLIMDGSEPEQLCSGHVALMKGELWEGNEHAGLVHRSPDVPDGEVRLLLTLDVSG